MNNTVTANVNFDYQGKNYDLWCKVNIDNVINHENFFNTIYLLLAKTNDIDLYSYQLEVMMDQDIVFSDENGCVQGCVNQGNLNLTLLKSNHEKVICLPMIEKIATRFATDNDITQALVDAYVLGKKGQQNSGFAKDKSGETLTNNRETKSVKASVGNG
jgi:hypothetical protein